MKQLYFTNNDFFVFDAPEDKFNNTPEGRDMHARLLESCIAAKKRVENQEFVYHLKKDGDYICYPDKLKDGSILNIPSNVEVEIYVICKKGSCMVIEGCYAEGLSFETCAAEQVARLKLKEEVKSLPESQDAIMKEFIWKYLAHKGISIDVTLNDLKSEFTIQRKL